MITKTSTSTTRMRTTGATVDLKSERKERLVVVVADLLNGPPLLAELVVVLAERRPHRPIMNQNRLCVRVSF